MPVGWEIVEARAAGTDPSFWQATSRGAGAEGWGGVLDYGRFVVSLSLSLLAVASFPVGFSFFVLRVPHFIPSATFFLHTPLRLRACSYGLVGML